MKIAVSNALSENPVPTLEELCKRLGYSNSGTLRKRFPGLCDQILERRRMARDQHITELRKILQSALLEWPVASLVTVCKRIGLSYGTLWKMWPEESAAIWARYLRHRRETLECRKEQMRQEVRRIVQRLHGEGKCPSVKRVRALLSKTTLKDRTAVQAAVKAARQELCHQV
jgi:hypothetical protein